MIEFLQDRFAPGPLFAWLCVGFLVAIPLIWLRARWLRTRATMRYSGTPFLRTIGSTWITRLRSLPLLLRTLAIVALVVALARPQAGGEYRATREGIAIQMVLDVSGSMATEDFVIDQRRVRRLDAVKRVFEDFVLGRGPLPGRENDLIGMTTFAMYADTRCPLTLDHGSLIDLLHATEIPGWVNGRQVRDDPEAENTALGDAIVKATDDLRRAGELAAAGVPGAEPAKSRIMILLTDGQDNPAKQFAETSPDPVEAARVAATLGIRIYTIGAAGNAPQRRGLFMRAAEVDEVTLQRIADATGGKYFRATDTESLVTIYDEIDRLERVQTGERVYQDDVFAANVAMLTGLSLLLLELLLSQTRFRRLP
ncbi:MAG: VWA domain-containing protein [Phycisphaerae bacterium]|nr:VWA domain-containing protein [Phycisphaerae bacterium]